ncbi:MAG: serine/threonine protein kinase, partial [Kiritimatiellae bacterium]|nr:serine/threonine protein kinase [Kiritimatiellia bacterium]
MVRDPTPRIKLDGPSGREEREAEGDLPPTVRLEAGETPQPATDGDGGAVASKSELATTYRILEKIGDGGMGVVYLAYDQKLGRYVAIKRLHRSALMRTSLKERFTREAKAIAALSHPHIVHVYAFGEDHFGPYIVMEYVAGPSDRSPNKVPPHPYTLADHVHRDGPLTLSSGLDLMIKLCRAVAYAHKCGVIHRDLKPSNILLTEHLEPKIADFGLARRRTIEEEQLTVPGERMLSLGYGAPEQEMDAMLTDERADVYGLGALFYFALTGKNPRYFRENDVPDVVRPILVKALETDRDR